MRAVAVLCVIGLHVAGAAGALDDSLGGRLLSRLNLGVTIFFVLSGFLLFRPFIAHRVDGPAPLGFRDYLWNRVLRIYPAYALVLTVLIVIPGLAAFSGVPLWKQYALIQTLPIGDSNICTDPTAGCSLSHTWSLVVEMTFYLALPLYVLASEALARRFPRGWAPRELVLLVVLSTVSVLFEFGALGVESRWIDTTVLGYFPWFAFGMALAIVSVAGIGTQTLGRYPMAAWGLAAAAYVGLTIWLPPSFLIFDDSDRMVGFLAFGLISALLVVPAVFGGAGGGLPRRLLGHRAMAWLGLISYGLFLWHLAVAGELAERGIDSLVPLFALTLAITAAIAAGSYYGLERWVLRRKRYGSAGRSKR